jgi:hypothetical protein
MYNAIKCVYWRTPLAFREHLEIPLTSITHQVPGKGKAEGTSKAPLRLI